MARVNVGVSPEFLSDQHLIAESVEITMISGSLRFNGYQVKGPIPREFTLGRGHVNFFKDKLVYLSRRLTEINLELERRGFKVSNKIDLAEFPSKYMGDWTPTVDDTRIVRDRITERLTTPIKARAGFHKYYGKRIDSIDAFCGCMISSELFSS